MTAASIIIVEDEAIIADDIERTLLRLGYNVPAVVAEGERAIEAAERYAPSLVLMDIKLRGCLDGIEAAQSIYERFGIPVVFLTSHSDPATISRASAARPNGYVMKPFVERDLRVAIEIALHKQEIESELRAKERWFSTTLGSIGDGVLATDEKLHVTFMNRVAEALTGWSNREATGRHIDEVFQIFNIRGAMLAGPAAAAMSSRETTYLPPMAKLLRKDGTEILVDDSAAAIIDTSGRTLGSVVVFRDATERDALEQRVSRSERLASLGTMAAGLCHEINNPLTSVLANLEYSLEADASISKDLRDCLQDSYEAAARIGEIVKDMRTFAQPIEEKKTTVSLRSVLDSAIKLTTHITRQHATLSRQYQEAPSVSADAGRLTQVFVNLLINAAQSIPPGNADQHRIELHLSTDGQGRAVVEVRDDGAGIAPEVLPRIFDPFFTTKKPGVGMGLGLSICSNIISGFGGELSADSTLGVGSTFRVSLPPGEGDDLDKSSPAQRDPLSPVRRILLVDDEESVARAASRALSGLHYVEICNDGHSALKRIRSAGAFDLVLCDLMMPNMSGVELYHQVLAENPSQASRFVFFTGGATSESARAFLASAGRPVLFKPFPQLSVFRQQILDLATKLHDNN